MVLLKLGRKFDLKISKLNTTIYTRLNANIVDDWSTTKSHLLF